MSFMPNERYIVHVDMDAFFAAIEQRDNPGLRGKPVVVGADPKAGRGRGVVSTCSYEARKFGIHSAMPISTAYRNCPRAVFLPVDMERYTDVSRQLYNIYNEFTPMVEPAGLDEAYLDITASHHLFDGPACTCILLKTRIKEVTRLTASVGLAPMKMAAKIASDLKKPDGFVQVSQTSLLDFLWPLPVDKICGLGKKTKIFLEQYGIVTIGDLARRNKDELISLLGRNGETLWQLANGIDERNIEIATEAKSISSETTFMVDTLDNHRIMGALFSLCESVSSRLRKEACKAKTVTLKVRFEGFDTYTKAVTMHKSTNFSEDIYKVARKLYDMFEIKDKKVRLIGVKTSGLLPGDTQDSLFRDASDNRKEEIYRAMERIKAKFGDDSICRAASRIMHGGRH
ncbi:MAG: DNA polymerase IV [Candidatus Omnitrophota bacterium]